jgi:proteasome accessory factor PafA2
VSIPKVVGLEQEYAILLKAGDEDLTAFDASNALIGCYAREIGLREPGVRMIWDYGHETPFQDIRGGEHGKRTCQQIVDPEENRRINTCLPNGARLYTDHAHPEYSTPECLGALDALACDKAGERILLKALNSLNQDLPWFQASLYKNNIDHQGHSFGSHENYLVDARAHQDFLVDHPEKAMRFLVPFLISRQVLAGAGRVAGSGGHGRPYKISQRAEFMEAVFGLETMYQRPLINTREEHHADPQRFRRLHLILGDANMCETAGFIKLGSTQLVLLMMEDGFLKEDLALADPLAAVRRIAEQHDAAVELADGRRLSAAQIQESYCRAAADYLRAGRAENPPQAELIVQCWQEALDGLEALKLGEDMEIEEDPGDLCGKLDWVLKLWLLNRFRAAKDLAWGASQLKVLDLKYHNIEPGQSLFYRAQEQGLARRLLEDDRIEHFRQHPPEDTRAYFRGKCIERFPRDLFLVNWEIVGFDDGEVHRMVPLLNPLKGTKRLCESFLEQAQNAQTLIALLRGEA